MKQLLLTLTLFLGLPSALWAAELSGANGVHKTNSAIPLGKHKLGAQLSYHLAPDNSWNNIINQGTILVGGTTTTISSFNSMSGSLGLTFGLSDQLDIGFMLPGYWDQGSEAPNGDKYSLGALQLSAKWAPGYDPSKDYSQKPIWAGLIKAHLPTGSEGFGTVPRYIEHFDGNSGSPSPLYGGKAAIDVAGLVTYQWAPFVLHGNLGARKWFVDGTQAVLYYGATAEWLAHKNITPFLELQKENRFNKMFTGDHFRTEPLDGTIGTKFHNEKGFNAQFGFTWRPINTFQRFTLVDEQGVNQSTYNVRKPVYEFFVGIGWQGTLRKVDRDIDKDGIMNSQDQCPSKPEDKDGFQDEDGCPDLDNDKDGIADAQDKCLNKSEDKDGFQDGDGCPDLDNDRDGILDTEDKCPNKKGVLKEKGCPAVVVGPVLKKNVAINLRGVNFKSGSSQLVQASYLILDPIIDQLKANPNVRIEISGHTDSQGSAKSNQRISEKRANSVKNYLISQGIRGSRMKVVGYGESTPIATNATKEGRAKNRRIEMKRLN